MAFFASDGLKEHRCSFGGAFSCEARVERLNAAGLNYGAQGERPDAAHPGPETRSPGLKRNRWKMAAQCCQFSPEREPRLRSAANSPEDEFRLRSGYAEKEEVAIHARHDRPGSDREEVEDFPPGRSQQPAITLPARRAKKYLLRPKKEKERETAVEASRFYDRARSVRLPRTVTVVVIVRGSAVSTS